MKCEQTYGLFVDDELDGVDDKSVDLRLFDLMSDDDEDSASTGEDAGFGVDFVIDVCGDVDSDFDDDDDEVEAEGEEDFSEEGDDFC